MTTPQVDALPNPGYGQGPEQHRVMSVRFLRHAERELAHGRRLQASEKIWGAATHQLAILPGLLGYTLTHRTLDTCSTAVATSLTRFQSS